MSSEGVKERMVQLEKLLSVMEELRNPRSPRGMFMTVLRFLQAKLRSLWHLSDPFGILFDV